MNKYIFHIPHSSTFIPDDTGYLISQDELREEICYVTDWATEKIFDVRGVDRLVVPFSRVFCDVERFYDDQEPMYKKGAGIAYSKKVSGQALRRVSTSLKKTILDKYYEPHHRKLDKLAEKKLLNFGEAVIIDCHSFSSLPLEREFNQQAQRPDICLGTDDFHTPVALAKECEKYFANAGLQVKFNQPYEGTMVPTKYYKRATEIKSIMIEINKKLYMNEATYQINIQAVKKLNAIVKGLFDWLK